MRATCWAALALLSGCARDTPTTQVESDLLGTLERFESTCVHGVEETRECAEYIDRCIAAGPPCTGPLEAVLATAASDPAAPAVVQLHRARLFFGLKRSDEERAAYHDALLRAQAQGRPRIACQALIRWSDTVDAIEAAALLLRRAVEIADAAVEPRESRRALYRLVFRYRAAGLYQLARQTVTQLTSRLATGEDSPELRTTLLMRADLARLLGDHVEAIDNYREVAERAQRVDQFDLAATAVIAWGVVELDNGRATDARLRFEQAGSLAERAKSVPRQREAAVHAALAALRSGAIDQALSELQKLMMDGSDSSDLAANHAQLYLGEAHRRRGQLTESIAAYRRALEIAIGTGRRELQWEVAAGLAAAQRAAGDATEARASARQAVEWVESLREAVTSAGERTQFLHVRADAHTALASALALSEPADLAGAFAVSEVAHARVLRESLSAVIRERGASAPRDLTLAELQRRLHPGDLLLSFQLGEPESLLLAIDPQSVTAHPLASRSQLDASIESYRRALLGPATRVALPAAADPEPSTWLSSGRVLSSLLLAPVAKRLGRAERLIVVPDRRLYDLPFEALPFPNEERQSDPTMLGLQLPVSYLPAASMLHTTSITRLSNVVIVAATAAWPEYRLPELHHAQIEADQIAALYLPAQQRRFRSNELDIASLKEAVRRHPDVLHLAAHARLSPREGPRILLGRDAASRSEILLDAATVIAAPIAPRLAVLSACDSARGTIVGGEGVLGLVRAFTQAGSQQVVASLWPVEDRSAGVLMHAFHERLTQGDPTSKALVEARRRVAREVSSHPYHWASFVLYASD